jgi:hypothetical protein
LAIGDKARPRANIEAAMATKGFFMLLPY